MSEYLSRSAVARKFAQLIAGHEGGAASWIGMASQRQRDDVPEAFLSERDADVARMLARAEAEERNAERLHSVAQELGLSCGCCGHVMLEEGMVCHGDCTDRECGRHKR